MVVGSRGEVSFPEYGASHRRFHVFSPLDQGDGFGVEDEDARQPIPVADGTDEAWFGEEDHGVPRHEIGPDEPRPRLVRKLSSLHLFGGQRLDVIPDGWVAQDVLGRAILILHHHQGFSDVIIGWRGFGGDQVIRVHGREDDVDDGLVLIGDVEEGDMDELLSVLDSEEEVLVCRQRDDPRHREDERCRIRVLLEGGWLIVWDVLGLQERS